MNINLDEIGKKLHEKIDSSINGLKSAKAYLENVQKETETAIQTRLNAAKDTLEAKKQEADSDNTWTVPFGGGIGKIFKIGSQPINAQVNGYYNAVSPDFGADWQLRFQLQFLFPK